MKNIKLILILLILNLIIISISHAENFKNYYGYGLNVFIYQCTSKNVKQEIINIMKTVPTFPGQINCIIPTKQQNVIFWATYCFVNKNNKLYMLKVPIVLNYELLKFCLKENKDLDAEYHFMIKLGQFVEFGFIDFEKVY